MGDFNLQCCVTKLSITPDDRIVVLPIIHSDTKWHFLNKNFQPDNNEYGLSYYDIFHFEGTFTPYDENFDALVTFEDETSFKDFLNKISSLKTFNRKEELDCDNHLFDFFEDCTLKTNGEICHLGFAVILQNTLDFYYHSENSPIRVYLADEEAYSDSKKIKVIFSRLSVGIEPVKALNACLDTDKETLDLLHYVQQHKEQIEPLEDDE